MHNNSNNARGKHADTIRIWYAKPDDIRDRKLLDSCRSVLSASEQSQYQRFRFDQDRHRYLVSHALLRRVLSLYIGKDPADWCFTTTGNGRPELASCDPAVSLRFNLTHTNGLSACIVTEADDCGIDAEKISQRGRMDGIAERMFSAKECSQLKSLSGNDYLRSFYTCWTLREAYVKAVGIGISFPTRKIQFEISEDHSVAATFAADIGDSGNAWQFKLLKPTDEHVVSLAVRKGNGDTRPIVEQFFEF